MAHAGYVKLRRGILDHLGTLTGSETKLYIALLCLATPATGRITATAFVLADIVALSQQTVSLDLKRLAALNYIGYKPARNQHAPADISIKKWAQCASTESIAATRRQPVGNPLATRRQPVGSAEAQASDQQEGASDSQKAREEEQLENKTHVAPESADLSKLLSVLILKSDEQAKTNPEAWAPDIDKLHRIDGREWGQIEKVIVWCQADSFWQPNIRSGKKLREKFATLLGQMKRAGNGQRQTQAEQSRAVLEDELRRCEHDEG